MHNSVWSFFFLFSYIIINIVHNLCLPRKIVEQNLHFPLCPLKKSSKEVHHCTVPRPLLTILKSFYDFFPVGARKIDFRFPYLFFFYLLLKYFCFHFSNQPAFSEIKLFFFTFFYVIFSRCTLFDLCKAAMLVT